MVIGHITQTGNISIPKKWREELGIEPNSSVIIEKKNNKIIIEPLNKNLVYSAQQIRKYVKEKRIKLTKEEIMKDELYD